MLAQDLRIKKIKKELDEKLTSGDKGAYAVLFRGEKKYLPIIKIDPRDLILNHKNNRLHGQLEDHPQKAIVLSDPACDKAQIILHKLLTETAEYSKLKDQLKQLGQREPGLITREGLLVNGNTRVAALRELGEQYVEVAVLPENITEGDVLSIEMDLQVTDLVHQDYSFTNELLLMRRYLDKGGSEKELARKMGWVRRGEIKVKTSMRLLKIIEEVRNLSKSRIKYSYFDNKSQHLKDLDNDYQNLKNSGDIDGAESLKWSRLTALFLDLNKDQVRAIDADFIPEELIPRLNRSKDSDPEAIEYLDKYKIDNNTIDPLFEEKDNKSDSSFDMKKFLEDFLNQDESADTDSINPIYATIAFAARRTSERIIDEQKLSSAGAEPVDVLIDIRERLVTMQLNLTELLPKSDFKKDKFIYSLNSVKDAISDIEKIYTVSKREV